MDLPVRLLLYPGRAPAVVGLESLRGSLEEGPVLDGGEESLKEVSLLVATDGEEEMERDEHYSWKVDTVQCPIEFLVANSNSSSSSVSVSLTQCQILN